MQRNTILFVIFSAVTVFVWYFLFAPQITPSQNQKFNEKAESSTNEKTEIAKDISAFESTISGNKQEEIKEETINIETETSKIVFTNKGAGILSWHIKEKNGTWVNLVYPDSMPIMANFPGSIYKIVSKSNDKIVFEYVSYQGWKIRKSFNISGSYMHNVKVDISKSAKTKIPALDFEWGPGLGTDEKEQKENVSLTRVSAFEAEKPYEFKKFKNSQKISAGGYKWSSIDNRYFLVSFIPENPDNFEEISSSRQDKKHPYSLTISAKLSKELEEQSISLNFYVGPKGYTYLKSYNLGLERTVDFGFFGFLGKIAFAVLSYFRNLTNNYGWAIIILTVCIQILVLPLTLKSFKSAASMKRIQPIVKDIQTKFKDNPQRLQAEMLNVYKREKVNPLSGCLPMLLQLPIFWAFFTMLRNAYELRNEGWILWVKDLSAADKFTSFDAVNINLLPLIMGIGMFFQQRMTTAVSDPMQKRIMYILPVVFTFMFWTFPSGLVLYWLTNSIISMIEQYFIIKKDAVKVKHI
jgi:YidC/Oxa1 family membrane protein insertase